MKLSICTPMQYPAINGTTVFAEQLRKNFNSKVISTNALDWIAFHSPCGKTHSKGHEITYLQSLKDSSILAVEHWVEIDVEGRKIRGKVDRVDDLGETLEVIDYKSSKSRTSKPKLKQDFQMALYWMGAEQAFGKPVSQVGHWYLREDREWMIELTEEERQAVLDRAKSIIEKIENGEFEPTPGYQVCQWCGYRMLCGQG